MYGPNVTLSADRTVARRNDRSFKRSYGWGYSVVVPAAPLTADPADGSWSYEVVIDSFEPRWGGGVELGFTSMGPMDLTSQPCFLAKKVKTSEFAASISNTRSWVLDLNGGGCWDNDWQKSRPGDRVRVQLFPDATFKVRVNGVLVTQTRPPAGHSTKVDAATAASPYADRECGSASRSIPLAVDVAAFAWKSGRRYATDMKYGGKAYCNSLVPAGAVITPLIGITGGGKQIRLVCPPISHYWSVAAHRWCTSASKRAVGIPFSP
jgi:hypothetical protein